MPAKFALRTTAVFVAAVLAVSAAMAGAAEPETRFARISKNGYGRPAALQLAIVTYAPQQGAEEYSVDLVSAIHIGDAAYYQDLNERFRGYDALLYELVIPADPGDPQTADSGAGFISRAQIGMKNMLGLTFQLEEIDYGAANFVHADLTSDMLAERMADRGESLYVYFWRIIFASLDEYARDPLGLKDWRLLSNTLAADHDDALKIAIAYEMVDASRADDILGGEEGSAVIAGRNEHAVAVLREQLDAGAKRIGIFYGVAHMADFEERLTSELGLSKVRIEWVDAWRFKAARGEEAGGATGCGDGTSGPCEDREPAS
jgi:hypothetical protein